MLKNESGYRGLESALQNGYHRLEEAELPLLDAYCGRYKAFLTVSRTERATVKNAISLAEKQGFRPYETGAALQSGDRSITATGTALCAWPSSARGPWPRG